MNQLQTISEFFSYKLHCSVKKGTLVYELSSKEDNSFLSGVAIQVLYENGTKEWICSSFLYNIYEVKRKQHLANWKPE
jgi:hypothetical protein